MCVRVQCENIIVNVCILQCIFHQKLNLIVKANTNNGSYLIHAPFYQLEKALQIQHQDPDTPVVHATIN